MEINFYPLAAANEISNSISQTSSINFVNLDISISIIHKPKNPMEFLFAAGLELLLNWAHCNYLQKGK
ncbi:MAG TPA: hypothetical protein DDY89_22310 [Lysinibacillus sp.]|nr:hypothetical protein [Lysinibacillus sp.]